MPTYFDFSLASLRQLRLRLFGFCLAMLLVLPAMADNASEGVLSFFQTERGAIESVLTKSAPLATNATWTKFATDQASLDTLVDDKTNAIDLSDPNLDAAILVNLIGTMDANNELVASFSTYMQSLQTVQSLLRTAANSINLVSIPFDSNIRSAFASLEKSGLILNKMSEADPVAFRILLSSVLEQDAYNRARFYLDLQATNPELAGHIFYNAATQGLYQSSDKYIEFLDKVIAATLVTEAYSSSLKRYGNLSTKEAATLYMQDRIIASWKKKNPGVPLRSGLMVFKKNNTSWLNFAFNALKQEAIALQDTGNDAYFDISATYLLGAQEGANLFSGRILPAPVANEFSGNAVVTTYQNSAGASTNLFNLESNYKITGDLLIQGGTLNLNGYELVITGNLTQTGGTLQINGGKLLVSGNILVQANSAMTMTNTNDLVLVGGSFEMDSCLSHTANFTAGTMDINQNFVQKTSCAGDAAATNFRATGTHKVIFSGTGKQDISFSKSGGVSASQFAFLTLSNEGIDGVNLLTPVVVANQIDGFTSKVINGSNLRLTGSAIQQGGVWAHGLSMDTASGDWSLEQDQTVQEFNLMGSTLDLKGKTLTVQGDLIQSGGTLKLSGGKLVVRGSYRIQTKNSDGSFAQSNGLLMMSNALDWVEVDGQFVMDSCQSHANMLVAGKMDLNGDFIQNASCSGDVAANNFRASATHQVILSGRNKQTISFAKPGASTGSRFAVLSLNNESKEGLEFSTPVVVVSRLEGVTANITNGGNLRLSGTAVQQNGVWAHGLGVDNVSGNLTLAQDQVVQNLNLAGSTLNLNGKTLTVQGNLTQTGGTLRVNQGRLVVLGDYRIQNTGVLTMDNVLDLVDVDGQFVMDSCVSHANNLVAGKLEVKGDFTQSKSCATDAASSNFKATGTHQVVLSGRTKQTVTFTSPSAATGSQFAVFIPNNESSGGVDLATPVVVSNTLDGITVKLTNGDRIRLAGTAIHKDGVYEYGQVVDTLSGNWTMNNDQIVQQLNVSDSTLNLNGKTLTVQGNLVHSGGTIRLGGGKLIVQGNYLVSNKGALVMTNVLDTVEVSGLFEMDSCISHTNNLTAGKMDIKGDFSQKTSCADTTAVTNFRATGSHTVEFTGRAKQSISFATPNGTNGSQFAALKFANSSALGVTLVTPAVVAINYENFSSVISNTGYLKLAYQDPNSGGTSGSNQVEIAFSLLRGWNLLGNSLNSSINVATVFSDANIVNTVWKWDAASSGWQFYAPSLDATALATFATSKGYKVLTEIVPGEGYWVNAKEQTAFPSRTGVPFELGSSHLTKGWNLVATGKDMTPSEFNLSLTVSLTPGSGIPSNVTTLWAWDNLSSQWFFYAPLLESNGGLLSFIESKKYLDFTKANRTLGNGIGFWVNRP